LQADNYNFRPHLWQKAASAGRNAPQQLCPRLPPKRLPLAEEASPGFVEEEEEEEEVEEVELFNPNAFLAPPWEDEDGGADADKEDEEEWCGSE
jgi:hypothetical protein